MRQTLTLAAALVGLSLSYSVHSVSLSAYKIVLDQDKRSDTMIIFNQNTQAEKCKVWLRDFEYDGAIDKLLIINEKKKEKVAHSAKPFVRMSPKSFTIGARGQQNVKFRMRRSLTKDDMEYKSMLAISCAPEEKRQERQSQVTITPKLVQNIPVYVRHKSLPVDITFTNIERTANNLVTFTLNNESKRSMWGTLQLVEPNTGKVIAANEKVRIYPENKSMKFSLAGESAVSAMRLEFVENQVLSGDYKTQTTVE